ncbi:ATPase [Methanobacterium formicicum]|uniref:tRNA methyl transferase-like protein n=1 Tax=Methanobacterium formicicum (strain DSM 3637 / PP1) TaxID=1204725 RepID=K2RAX8_METFP|nr:ATPase [Methanobacterium formicicum]EKF85474.1 tRNA methyl transferase-like protein [Methanobacterium formicicum DSM 3637]
MNLEKKDLISLISKIRKDIGHKDVEVDISNIIFNEESGTLLIITPDRPEKSVVIGKGGWVVGRLREELGVNSIHVEAYSDFIVPQYRMGLALARLEEITAKYPHPYNKPLLNLINLLRARIENPYDVESLLTNYPLFNNQENFQEERTQTGFRTVVALSGGVDSSSSLIIAQMLGFNPLAVTVNPGDIILPRYFRESVENLTQKLGVEHQYLEVDMSEVVTGSLQGQFHPCGRCSKVIEEAISDFTRNNHVPFLIYGDLLSTGAQSLQMEINRSGDNNDGSGRENNLGKGNFLRINLPALLSFKKGDVKKIAGRWGVKKRGGYGCPLIMEVHKKHPHMHRFSIQRVLRETRAGILEPGEALNQIKG